MALALKGWIRTSLADYPDHIATVLFTGGCNFRCPMCHNAELVLHADRMPTLPEADVWRFLERRQGLVDGVVITGGEPTLDCDLPDFLGKLRSFEGDIKLDTNGYRPDVLGALLREGLVDYVAMDVKAPPAKYALLTGRSTLEVDRLRHSIALLQESDIEHEFRTTVVPRLLDEEDIAEIASWLADAERYVLQQFRPMNTLDAAWENVSPYPPSRLRAMADLAAEWVSHVLVRGIRQDATTMGL